MGPILTESEIIMTTLSDTHLIVFSAAFQRPGFGILPLPERLKGGADAKAVAGLLRRGLAEGGRCRVG